MTQIKNEKNLREECRKTRIPKQTIETLSVTRTCYHKTFQKKNTSFLWLQQRAPINPNHPSRNLRTLPRKKEDESPNLLPHRHRPLHRQHPYLGLLARLPPPRPHLQDSRRFQKSMNISKQRNGKKRRVEAILDHTFVVWYHSSTAHGFKRETEAKTLTLAWSGSREMQERKQESLAWHADRNRRGALGLLAFCCFVSDSGGLCYNAR